MVGTFPCTEESPDYLLRYFLVAPFCPGSRYPPKTAQRGHLRLMPILHEGMNRPIHSNIGRLYWTRRQCKTL